jgi:hypothetical protein
MQLFDVSVTSTLPYAGHWFDIPHGAPETRTSLQVCEHLRCEKNMQKRVHPTRRNDGPRKPRTRITRDQKNGTVTVSLRIPVPMLTEIDDAVKNRPYKMPRHLWLLEAIHEKLGRLREPPIGDTER